MATWCQPVRREAWPPARPAGPWRPEALELAVKALEELGEWITRFDDETMPYESQTRAKYTNDYGDFDHLARRGEWASAPDGSEGGE